MTGVTAERGREDSFFTLTHARIRAAQGDLRGARAILSWILQRRPGDGEALALLRRLEADASEVGKRVTHRRHEARIQALEAWLARVRCNAGGPRAG